MLCTDIILREEDKTENRKEECSSYKELVLWWRQFITVLLFNTPKFCSYGVISATAGD